MGEERLEELRRALAHRYAIEREIGSGGMATVYLADDLKHDRKVAIKVIKDDVASALGLDRFIREIQVAAKLSHPNIMPLYDSGTVEASPFYVMPYVAGESLRQRIEREHQLPVPEAISLVRQVAAALSYAHARGLVHRDISPENILLHEGAALVTDFGIALAMDQQPAQRLTSHGVSLGKAEYMSPEQVSGDRTLDARSDVYSLACVLYELLSGEPPFTGATTQAIMAKRFTDPVPSVRRLRPAVPSGVDRVLMTALAKAPADRFSSVAEFAVALEKAPNESVDSRSVAVLPFLNLSRDPDNEYFADGITEDVIAHLSKVRSLKVISRGSVMQFKDRTRVPREIGQALHTATILDGSVRRAGDRVRIVAELIDTDKDQNLWAETYDRQLTDIFAIQSDVAVQIATALKAELSPDEQTRIRKEPTRNLLAYQLYLQGRQRFSTFVDASLHEALAYYERAIGEDPDFALAHAAMAYCYAELVVQESWSMPLQDAYQRAKAAAQQAVALDPTLGDAHGVLGLLMFTYEFNWSGAEQSLKKALELSPGSADIHAHYTWLCTAMGRYEEAIPLARKALELDPFVHRGDYATSLLRAGRYDEAVAACFRNIEREPGYARGHATLGWAYLKLGRSAEGIAALEKAAQLTPGDTGFVAQLGQAYGLTGEREKALAVLRQLEELQHKRYVSPYHLAFVYTGLGEHDKAMDLLEHAYEVRAGALYNLKGSLVLAPLRSHPRFQALLRKINLA